MQRSERIVRYTADELEAMRQRGESQTDFAYLDALTEEELEASIDHEEEGEFDWSTARPGLADLPGVERVTLNVDRYVADWFKAQGGSYRTRMNAVLRAYVEAQKRAAASSRS